MNAVIFLFELYGISCSGIRLIIYVLVIHS
jgi:hypothetical protein